MLHGAITSAIRQQRQAKIPEFSFSSCVLFRNVTWLPRMGHGCAAAPAKHSWMLRHMDSRSERPTCRARHGRTGDRPLSAIWYYGKLQTSSERNSTDASSFLIVIPRIQFKSLLSTCREEFTSSALFLQI